ncbi:hypothetical protein GCM10020255_018450 [Rhodococcus baikonurensis]
MRPSYAHWAAPSQHKKTVCCRSTRSRWSSTIGSATDYEGIALNTAERERLVKDLGTHPALILRNHGLLTVGETASEAFLRMFYLEKACDIQIAAQASGSLRLPSLNWRSTPPDNSRAR